MTARASLLVVATLAAGLGRAAEPAGAEQVFNLIQEGKHAAARARLDALLRLNPQDAILLSADAFLSSQAADHAGAIHSARRALARNPQLDFARNILALSLIASGKRPEGIRELESLHTRNPEQAGTLRNLGLAYLQAGALAKGTALLEKRLRQASDDHLVRVDLIGTYLRLGKRAEAIRHAEQVPGAEAELIEKLCTVLNERDEYSLCLAKLALVSADSPSLAIVRAESLIGLGRLKEAETALHAISPDEQQGNSYALTAAWLRTAKDDLPGAVRLLQQAAQSPTATDRVFHALSMVFLRGSAPKEALDAAERGLERWPESAVLHFSAGMAREFNGDHQNAQSALRRSIALDPANGLAHYVLALSQQIAGADWPAVSAAFRAALELRPADTLIASNYAREAARREDWILAERLARGTLAASSEYAGAAHAVLGRVALARGQFDTASKHLEAAVAKDPDEYPAAYRLGLEYVRRGEKEKARAYFAKYKEFKTAAEERDQEKRILVRLAHR